MRLFVAIELDEAVRAALRKVQSGLKAYDEVRWIPAEQLHVTVKFLGDVRDDDVPGVCEALTQGVEGSTPFDVEVSGCGCFPPRGPVRIVWAGLKEESGVLKRLAANVDTAMALVGFEPEQRPFSAHVTIGRVRDDRSGGRLREAVSAFAYDAAFQSVKNVTLMSSVLSPKGPTYTPVQTAGLG